MAKIRRIKKIDKPVAPAEVTAAPRKMRIAARGRRPERVRHKSVRRISLRRRRLTSAGLTWLFFSLVVGSALFYGASWAGSDKTCLGCHEVQPASTAHEESACISCHRPMTLSGNASFAAEYSEMLWRGYVMKQDYRPGSAMDFDPSACLRCHGKVVREEKVASGVRVYHAHLVDEGFRCGRCHESAGHAVSALRPRSVMEQCLRCHDGDSAASECKTCHAGRPSDVAGDWRGLQPVSVGMRGSCAGCHSKQQDAECFKCHGGYVMPHPEGWVSEGMHGYDGLMDQPDCFDCHTQSSGVKPAPHGSPYGGYGGGFCSRCHSYPSPHGERTLWIRSHGPASRGVEVGGQYCSCHGNGVIQQCLVCHSQTVCDRCHAERDKRARAKVN